MIPKDISEHMRNISYDIHMLNKLNFNMYGQDFLLTTDKTVADLRAVRRYCKHRKKP